MKMIKQPFRSHDCNVGSRRWFIQCRANSGPETKWFKSSGQTRGLKQSSSYSVGRTRAMQKVTASRKDIATITCTVCICHIYLHFQTLICTCTCECTCCLQPGQLTWLVSHQLTWLVCRHAHELEQHLKSLRLVVTWTLGHHASQTLQN